jgi:hypothetical protein
LRLEEAPIDAAVSVLVLEEPFGDSLLEGLAKAFSVERSGSQVLGAGGDSLIRDVGYGSAPDWLCWHCWYQCTRFNNALIPNIGRLICLREGESLHVVCVVRFDAPTLLVDV